VCLACRLRSFSPALRFCFRFFGQCTTIRLALAISWMSRACSTALKAASCSLAGNSRSLAATSAICAFWLSLSMMHPAIYGHRGPSTAYGASPPWVLPQGAAGV
jgi:hypothetical protein